jgi:hypothetical protein
MWLVALPAGPEEERQRSDAGRTMKDRRWVYMLSDEA